MTVAMSSNPNWALLTMVEGQRSPKKSHGRRCFWSTSDQDLLERAVVLNLWESADGFVEGIIVSNR